MIKIIIVHYIKLNKMSFYNVIYERKKIMKNKI